MNKPLAILGTGLCCPTPERLAEFELEASAPNKVLLPPLLRRRAGLTTRLAVTAATEACQRAGVQPQALPAVFASLGGEIQVTDILCRELADPEGSVSPTLFHNSVHNSTAAYWSILHKCCEASIAIAALDDTFAMGLQEAWNQTQLCEKPILLVCYDEDWPQYLASPTGSMAMACALIVSGTNCGEPTITQPYARNPSIAYPSRLEELVRQAPAAAAVPLLAAVAAGVPRTAIPLNYAGVRWYTDLVFDPVRAADV